MLSFKGEEAQGLAAVKLQQTRSECHLVNNGGQKHGGCNTGSFIRIQQKWHERFSATLNWRCQVESATAAPFYQLAKPAGKENADHWLETDGAPSHLPNRFLEKASL